jgi:hypothetical protein
MMKYLRLLPIAFALLMIAAPVRAQLLLLGVGANGGGTVLSCTGGTQTSGLNGGTIFTFTSSGTLTCNQSFTAQILVVGGGGAGGANENLNFGGGGGGAGGYCATATQTCGLSSSVTIPSGATTVTVGTGGTGGSGTGPSGNNSILGTLVNGSTGAVGGGGGRLGANTSTGVTGGSGGGAAGSTSITSGGSGTATQGNSGGGNTGTGLTNGPAGGGGGVNSNGGGSFSGGGGAGSAGIINTISDSAVIYAAGGGGGSSGGSAGAGGSSGSGGAGSSTTTGGAATTPGSGGGGAGGSTSGNHNGGSGSNGIVIISNEPLGLTLSGPSSGTVAAPSTNFTVNLINGTFNGSQTVTLSDGSLGGTFTPSVGSPGTSTVTVTPAANAPNFTFTYAPAVVATVTLSVTNAQGWFNPSSVNYASSVCSQYTTLAGRLDGTENTSAVTNLICGLVADGTYSKFDLMYVGYGAGSAANVLVNWAQSSFPLTQHGSVTYNGTNGITGDGSTGYFTTGYTPSSSGQITQNSLSLGACVVNSRTSGTPVIVALGTNDGTHEAYTIPLTATPNWHFAMNSNGGADSASANTNAQGARLAVRTASANVVPYLNGSAQSTTTLASNGVPTTVMDILVFNNNGTLADFSSDTHAYILLGGGLTGTQATNVYNRFHTYLQAVGETSAC